MQPSAKLALVLLLALSVNGCASYAWRPLQEATMEKYPDMGRVRLQTSRGSVELEDAKATRVGVEGNSVAPEGTRLMVVPRAEILGGEVYEQDVQQRNKVIIGLSVGFGILGHFLLISSIVGGLNQPSYGSGGW